MIAKVVFRNAPREDGSVELRHLTDGARDDILAQTIDHAEIINDQTLLVLKNEEIVSLGAAPAPPDQVVEIIAEQFNGLMWTAPQNMPGMMAVPGVGPQGSNAFVVDSYLNMLSPQKVSVNPDDSYRVSAWIRHDSIPNGYKPIHYIGLACYDYNGSQIEGQHVTMSTPTTLATPLAVGDQFVELDDYTNFDSSAPNGHRKISLLNYKNQSGYNYGTTPYTKWVIDDAWERDADFSSGIPLKTSWNYANPEREDGVWPAGYPLANGRDGTTFKYVAADGVQSETYWTKVSGVISGTDLTGEGQVNSFPPGTCRVAMVMLLNYQSVHEARVYVASPEIKRIG